MRCLALSAEILPEEIDNRRVPDEQPRCLSKVIWAAPSPCIPSSEKIYREQPVVRAVDRKYLPRYVLALKLVRSITIRYLKTPTHVT